MSIAIPSSGMHAAPAARAPRERSRRSGTGTGRRCGRRGATAGDRSSCAACRARSCWCGGRSTSARPSAGSSARRPGSACGSTGGSGLKRRVWPPIAMRPVSCCTSQQLLRRPRVVGDRDLDLHVLAGAHALDRPARACICVGRGQDRGLDAGLGEALGEIRATSAECRTSAPPRAVESALPPASETTSMPGIFWMRLDVLDAESALSRNADLHAMFLSLSSYSSDRGTEPERRVGSRHVIEADMTSRTFGSERAAHHQPHHHLDAFGAGLAHVLDDARSSSARSGIVDHAVEEALVPLAVDEARRACPAADATCRRCRR